MHFKVVLLTHKVFGSITVFWVVQSVASLAAWWWMCLRQQREERSEVVGDDGARRQGLVLFFFLEKGWSEINSLRNVSGPHSSAGVSSIIGLDPTLVPFWPLLENWPKTSRRKYFGGTTQAASPWPSNHWTQLFLRKDFNQRKKKNVLNFFFWHLYFVPLFEYILKGAGQYLRVLFQVYLCFPHQNI